MNRFDSILSIAGKVFAFSAIALILAPLVALSFLFFAYLLADTGWLISILVLVLMLVGVRTVAVLVPARIEAPKSFYKLLLIKIFSVSLFLLLASLGCIGTRCWMILHPG